MTLLLLGIDCVQFARGDFEAALSLCNSAANILSASGRSDSQAYSCMGVAASYLGLEVCGYIFHTYIRD